MPRGALTEEELDERLSRPTPGVQRALERCPGDVIVLGAAGKMGPSLARMLRRAMDDAGSTSRVIAVSRFSAPAARKEMERQGIETIACDLLDRSAVARLPDAPNVIYMAGQKFGTTDAPAVTWMMNTVAPAIAAERYAGAGVCFVAFSTGNIYPLVRVASGGARESDAPAPVGEYAASCLGRERVLEYHAARYGTPTAIVRLNYAIALRYGVLTDIAAAVWRGEPVDVGMGSVNVIWQGDANAWAVRCLAHASVPPFVINVTGRETVSVRSVAQRFGELLDRTPRVVGTERDDALLSDATLAHQRFGAPTVSLDEMITMTAEWVRAERPLLGKPTHFQARDGRF
ncbi:MAG TPA: NAD(P)-dependent oxidoreductase [Gemmatimonadaceae bacterium]|nr:NAD(P)-dependent oxidoreductase [Gemmatimonadaceae bacterium]